MRTFFLYKFNGVYLSIVLIYSRIPVHENKSQIDSSHFLMWQSQQLPLSPNSISHLRLWCSAGWLIAILQLSDSRSFKSVGCPRPSPPLSPSRHIPIKRLASLSALWSQQMKLLCAEEAVKRRQERERVGLYYDELAGIGGYSLYHNLFRF